MSSSCSQETPGSASIHGSSERGKRRLRIMSKWTLIAPAIARASKPVPAPKGIRGME